jgi:hypothetical protein
MLLPFRNDYIDLMMHGSDSSRQDIGFDFNSVGKLFLRFLLKELSDPSEHSVIEVITRMLVHESSLILLMELRVKRFE